ncbi:probable WRKY transcription factor 13 [Rutidosis leptorrhynchoides]|uniref:probable WRKY transcription factor 13 n=1 Tax=Rutidosis leptorrhynchoides TaxID=125765 RepID=UPI003A999AF7
MLNQGLILEDQEMGFFHFPFDYSNQALKPQHFTDSHYQTSHHLPLHSSDTNHWACSEIIGNKIAGISRLDDDDDHHHNNLGVSGIKMMKKQSKSRKRTREPRFCFKTMSDVDVMDDGYKWRKYGQKVVKNTQHPRSYYRCTQDNCRVKKRVERLAEDPRMVITTYEGRHAHSPSLNEEDSEANSSKICDFLWL